MSTLTMEASVEQVQLTLSLEGAFRSSVVASDIIRPFLRQALLFDSSCTVGTVHQALLDDVAHVCAVVVDSYNQPIGLVMKDRFCRILASRFAVDLYYRRPITLLMDSEPLWCGLDLDPFLTIDAAVNRGAERLYDSILVMVDGQLAGIIEMADLLQMSSMRRKEEALDHVQRIQESERMLSLIHTSTLEVSQASKEATGQAEAMQQETQAGKKQLQLASVAMEDLRQMVERQAEQMARMKEKSDSIHQISRLIREIMEQSGILSLNASIEAARAGIKGSGFAAVASEMRRLSEETRQAASSIQRMIREMTEAIAEMGESVEQSRFRAADSRHSFSETQRLFDAIYERADANIACIHKVDTLTHHTYTHSERIARYMQQLAQALLDKR